MRGKAELGGRDSTGVSPVSNRKAKACSGRAPHRARAAAGRAGAVGITGEWQRHPGRDPRGPGTPARPHHVAAARHVQRLGPAPPPNQRAGAELPPSHWLTPSPPRRAVRPPAVPPPLGPGALTRAPVG